MSDFLENLKNSVEKGEFNSEVANKINEINKRADEISKTKSTNELEEAVKERLNDADIKTLDNEQQKAVEDKNTEYEEKMSMFKRENEINSTVAEAINLSHSFKSAQTHLMELMSKLNETEFEEYKKMNPEDFELIETIINLKI